MLPKNVNTPEGVMKGSMASPSKIEQQINKDREAEAAAHDQKTKESAESLREGESPAQEKESPFELPKLVDSVVYGRIKFEKFREHYAPVFEAVRDKVHLTAGRVTFKTTMTGGMKISLSSLSKREHRFVNYISRGESSIFKQMTTGDQEELGRWLLVLSLRQYGQSDLSVPPPPPIYTSGPLAEDLETSIKKYLKDEVVQKKLEWVDNLANEVFVYLFNAITDVFTALYLAIQEDMENPSEPL